MSTATNQNQNENVAALRTTRRITQAEIAQLLNVYENDDFFEYWSDNVAKDMSEEVKAIFRRHFPRGNFLKRIVQRMTQSLPSFEVKFLEADGEEMEEDKADELQAWVRRSFDRPGWEGKDTFWQALSFWREMVFVTGRLTVKHVTRTDRKGDSFDSPQRMPQLGIDYQLASDDRKKIIKWLFRYIVDGGTGELAQKETMVTETIDAAGSSKQVANSSPETAKHPPELLGEIPVSFMAWEKIEGEPLGVPYARRILRKILNILSILTDMRNANRLNSDPIKALINAQLEPGVTLRAGMTVTLVAKNPGQQVDLKAVGGNLSLEGLTKELENALHDLYEDASLPFPGRDQMTMSNASSGKALHILSAPMIEYQQAYLPEERGFIEHVIYIMGLIEGKDLEQHQIQVIHDPRNQPTPAERNEEARALFDAGFISEGLRRLGVDEDQIPDLLAERAEEKSSASADSIAMFGSDFQKDLSPEEQAAADKKKAEQKAKAE